MTKFKFIAAGLIATLAIPASAWAFQVPPVTDASTLKECSACHMVFPPQMLPARSWTAMMGDLANHFGEDASVDAQVQADITAYLTANAADTPPWSRNRRLLAGVKTADVPQRITEMPWWKRAHHEVSARRYARADVKSAANCIACHKTADKGNFSEEEDD